MIDNASAALTAISDDKLSREQHPDSPPLPFRTTHGMGWKPDLPDVRDFLFDPRKAATRKGLISARQALKVPVKVDLRTTGFLPSVYDQGALGSCTANAIAGAYEYEQKREGLTDYTPSRLAIYFWEREIEGSIAYDAGAFIRDGFTVINKIGAPSEALWPYSIAGFTVRPSQPVYNDAALHRSITYARIPTGVQTACKAALAAQTPVVFGFTVYSSFFDTGSNGIVKTPDVKRENIEGGHAVLMVGYEKLKSKGIFYAIVRNSWGSSWGDQGYCYFPMTWLMNPNNADDFWAIQDVSNA